MTKRHRGFVIGSDKSRNESVVWKVRVKDSESEYDRKKILVASVKDELVLAQGINVNFVIATIDDNQKRKQLRAIDVAPV